MKAVQWLGPRDMRLVEVDKPVPAPHEAVVRVESVGVCGSDIHYYLDGRIGGQVITPPVILGHEYAGIVEAVGAEADAGLVGKRVAVEPGIPCLKCESCRTGHYNVCREMFFPGGPGNDGACCEYMTVHADFCFPVPDGMSAQKAALIEPVAVALHTVELAGIVPGETAAIAGLGPIGLLTAQVAKLAGVHVLYGADLHGYRVEAGRACGVDVAFRAEDTESTIRRIMDATGGRGVDVGIDCTNTSEGLRISVEATRAAGRCVLTGISGTDYDPLPVSTARRRELTLHWCRRFCHNFPAAIALVASGHIDLNSLITHSFPLEKTGEAFEIVSHTRDNVLKASIDQ